MVVSFLLALFVYFLDFGMMHACIKKVVGWIGGVVPCWDEPIDGLTLLMLVMIGPRWSINPHLRPSVMLLYIYFVEEP